MAAVALSEIVSFVSGRYGGPADVVIEGVRPLGEAGERHISFLANPKYAPQLEGTRAAAVLVAEDLAGDDPRWIRVANPYYAMATVVARFFAARPMPEGISPHAAIDPSARIGNGVRIGAFVSIGAEAEIGDGAVIYPHVTIEAGAAIGEQTIVYPQVSIYYGCRIGRRCIIHSGVVIGSDGYGFATLGGVHHKIPQVGIVRVEDDVEIGAGTTIDRAALGETRDRRGDEDRQPRADRAQREDRQTLPARRAGRRRRLDRAGRRRAGRRAVGLRRTPEDRRPRARVLEERGL